ncbi:MAG: hypothetical protein IJ764_03265 [Bacteroidales bacterium]|nr:hypothetical protein [Bacteroidales bacterium]
MAKKIKEILPLRKGYDWQYCSLGGVTRVKISSGEDIAHLGELDRKLWSVLSCPVSGLEFDGRTLEIMDSNHDGKLRIDEVVDAAQWITSVLRNPDDLLLSSDSLQLAGLSDTETAQHLKAACERILNELQRPLDVITMRDVQDYKALIDERYAQEVAAEATEDVRPYGDDTAAVTAAVNALRDKVADYFMRCSLIRFDADCLPALDVSVDRIAAIASGDVAKAAGDIASYPLARPNAEGTLALDNVNPAWAGPVQTLRQYVLGEAVMLDEARWGEIVGKVDAYADYMSKQADGIVTLRSQSQTEAMECYVAAERLMHIYRDFYTLLKNYVFFKDFYQNDPDVKAVFQSGRLFIDQRCCELCVRVEAIDAHAAMASASGMYLLYCTCTSREKNESMNIVAVLTDGDVDNMEVGKNAIYYDRNGHCWDAVVTKIVDNPISIRQAFWSPYRKFWKWCTDKINKSAAEKEDKAFNDLTAKADTAVADVSTATAEGGVAEANAPKASTPFDIAKFAGIFAAIGMAIGFIGSALAGLAATATAKWYNLPLIILAIIVVVSGPSMFIAWTKLRKRNLGPILNANGWAVNAVILVNIRFGATLTSLAKYPTLVLDDPFAEKKTAAWKKWLVGILIVLAIAAIVILVCRLTHSPEAEVTSVVADTVKAACESIAQ